jgi:hypothetical protein
VVAFGLVAAKSSQPASAVAAATIPTRPAVLPVMACTALPGAFQQLDEAPTSIQSAALVGTGTAQYCDVKGWIAPQTQFEVRLPTTTWQGRFIHLGCGGNCGFVSFSVPAADSALAITSNQFVLAADNEGHTSTGGVDVWAAGGEDNPLRAQFGYLAKHLTSIVSKSLIRTYYGQPAAYSYFVGYSDGGLKGIQEAQRYPDDYDGIDAGAPATIITYAMESFVWAAQHMLNASNQQIFDTTALNALHNAAVAACDPTDGTTDNQLSDPRLCHWDPVAIQCSATLTTNCLTPEQVTVAREMYAGPRADAGTRHEEWLWPGGQAYGAELAWPSFAGAGVALGGSFTKYMLFEKDRPASYTWRDFQFDQHTWRDMDDMAKVYNANDFNRPDLSDFDEAGGKLIVWESWGDEAAGPSSTIDWYAQVVDKAKGLANTQAFARLFKVPSGNHGQASAGVPYSMETLSSLIDWVENGTAPVQLDAVAKDSGGNVTRTYPVFAYPARAKYVGSGSVADAANWVSATPSPLPDDHFDWLGDNKHGAMKP